ncbi:MAG: nucleotidyltransferase domain-containing protein [Proteobacteria bacterium]|nr:nucleotidyltransferase domain-containing protein [Pseudomonadota bacterium]
MNEIEIDLPERVITAVSEVAGKFPEIERIDVFGSRVLGNAKQGSDIDLAVFGQAVTPEVVSAFREYLEEETNLPYFFDIIHFELIENADLREHIAKYGRSLYDRKTYGKGCLRK